MAIKSLLAKDIKKLGESLNDSINYVDIDYDIKSHPDNPWTTKTRSMVYSNSHAVLNGYRLWLQSKRYDYIRAPHFGGLFESNLNDQVYLSPENEEIVKGLIMQQSAQKWPDITVLDCEVKAVMSTREWRIKILAQDKETKMVLLDEDIDIAADDADTNR